MISEIPQGKEKNHLMDLVLEEKVNKFCLLNHPSMEKWVTMHEEEHNTISLQREEYRCTQPNTSNVQYPSHLKEPPRFITIDWLYNAIHVVILRGEHVTEIEREFARGFQRRYKSFGALWSHGQHF